MTATRAALDDRELSIMKEMFHRLHNLEDFPDVADVHMFLINALDKVLSSARTTKSCGILSIQEFSAEALNCFVEAEEHLTVSQWESYVESRKTGSPRELFRDRNEARHWLKQKAPLKCVDGAWLGNIHKVDTPFHLRDITRDAWRILSEELGDGDLKKSHVKIYQKLLKDVGVDLPDAHSKDFVDPRHGLDQVATWRAAVLQLAISLFPHELLPEALGFNLHFEMLTLETLKAMKELRELDIDETYFLLHVCIDNSHSGHTAIATRIITDYLELISRRDGSDAVAQAWTRIQAGYLLSERLGQADDWSNLYNHASSSSMNTIESKLAEIFRVKAQASHKLHCSCNTKLNGKSLVEWLDLIALDGDEQRAFLDALSSAKPWVIRGDSRASKLVQALRWGGKMYGAFDEAETALVAQWIDSLDCSRSSTTYRSLSARGRPQECAHSSCPHDKTYSEKAMSETTVSVSRLVGNPNSVPEQYDVRLLALHIDTSRPLDLESFIPLWFAHQCLLESFVRVPSRTCRPSMAAVINILRAQHGFVSVMEGEPEVHITGEDKAGKIDLIAVGHELADRAGWARQDCLHEVLARSKRADPSTMLEFSRQPGRNEGILLGMSFAMCLLHTCIADGRCPFVSMSRETAKTLGQIALGERAGFELYFNELDNEPVRRKEFIRGFRIASVFVDNCFVA